MGYQENHRREVNILAPDRGGWRTHYDRGGYARARVTDLDTPAFQWERHVQTGPHAFLVHSEGAGPVLYALVESQCLRLKVYQYEVPEGDPWRADRPVHLDAGTAHPAIVVRDLTTWREVVRLYYVVDLGLPPSCAMSLEEAEALWILTFGWGMGGTGFERLR